jgi:hypothetical protein
MQSREQAGGGMAGVQGAGAIGLSAARLHVSSLRVLLPTTAGNGNPACFTDDFEAYIVHFRSGFPNFLSACSWKNAAQVFLPNAFCEPEVLEPMFGAPSPLPSDSVQQDHRL